MKIIRMLLFISIIGLLVGCDTPLLLNHLSQRQSNEVLAVLQAYGIDASRKQDAKQGDSIRVNNQDFALAVDLLQQYNLPSKEPVEIIQAFPGDSLVASPQAERTRLLSLIEQRLEQSLLIIPDVINARIHVTYPLNNHGVSKYIQKISCLITYSGNEEDKLMMHKIKLFLTGSFADTNYDNVSVVIINKPPLQYKVHSNEPLFNFNLILIIAITIISIVLTSLLILLYRKHIFKNKHNIKSNLDNIEQNESIL